MILEGLLVEKKFKITSAEGLHARPCTLLVSAATPFDSEIQITYKERSVNLKSIMGVMSLGIPSGSVVLISAEGSDANTALSKISEVISSESIGIEC